MGTRSARIAAALTAIEAPTGQDLVYARLAARLSPAEAAALCGIHRTTYLRQERGQARVSLAVYRLLLVMGGLMPWPDWAGWACLQGRLYPPWDTPRGYSPADVLRLEWVYQQLSAERARVRALTQDSGSDGATPGTVATTTGR